MQQLANKPAFWSVVMILASVLLITPLQLLVIHFIIVPVVMLAVLCTPRNFALYYGIPAILLIALSGSAWLFTFIFLLIQLVPGAAIGTLYRRNGSARAAITAGIVGMIAVLLCLLVGLALAGINIQHELKLSLHDQLLNFNQISGTTFFAADDIDLVAGIMVRWIPLYIIFISFYFAVVTHWVSRRLLRAIHILVKGMPPIHEWALPRSLVFYYLIALVLEYIVPADGLIMTLIWNVLPILIFVFTVQGISFYFYLANKKKSGKVLPIVAIIAVILLPPVMYLTSFVGLIDTSFPIRKKFK